MRAIRTTDGRYNYCPNCRELWGAAWMREMGIDTCPSCETTVIPLLDARSPHLAPGLSSAEPASAPGPR